MHHPSIPYHLRRAAIAAFITIRDLSGGGGGLMGLHTEKALRRID